MTSLSDRTVKLLSGQRSRCGLCSAKLGWPEGERSHSIVHDTHYPLINRPVTFFYGCNDTNILDADENVTTFDYLDTKAKMTRLTNVSKK